MRLWTGRPPASGVAWRTAPLPGAAMEASGAGRCLRLSVSSTEQAGSGELCGHEHAVLSSRRPWRVHATRVWAGQGGSTMWNCRQFAALGHWVALQNTGTVPGRKRQPVYPQGPERKAGRKKDPASWPGFRTGSSLRAGQVCMAASAPRPESECLLQHLLRAAGRPCLSPFHAEKATGHLPLG